MTPNAICERGTTIRTSSMGRFVFPLACVALFAALCLLLPPYFPLMEADSAGYISFAANRTALYPLFLRACAALGLDLVGITYVQTALFCVALFILVQSLERSGFKRWLIALFAFLLGANLYFSTFQRTIMTESIGFSVIAIATAFLLDYLRTGRALFLALSGFFIGLAIGIRPAGLMIAPMLVVAMWLKWHRRDVSAALLLVALVVPPAGAWGIERLVYTLEHGKRSDTVAPYVMTGKAAMLMKKDTPFTGPHAASLRLLGEKLYETYVPAHAFLAGLPSWVAWPVLTAFYEGAAQFQVIDHDVEAAGKAEGTTPDRIRIELGEQAIRANIPGYLRLTLTHYIGQWSVTALTFPPAAKAVNAYRESLTSIPLFKEITYVPFFPEPSWKSIIAYPAFAMAGMVTFALSFWLLRYLWHPHNADQPRHHDLMVAAFFAVMCHSSMLLTSFVNVSTPRFLMMVYPHILLAFLFLLRARKPSWAGTPLTER
jgi:hypothetical protein